MRQCLVTDSRVTDLCEKPTAKDFEDTRFLRELKHKVNALDTELVWAFVAEAEEKLEALQVRRSAWGRVGTDDCATDDALVLLHFARILMRFS